MIVVVKIRNSWEKSQRTQSLREKSLLLNTVQILFHYKNIWSPRLLKDTNTNGHYGRPYEIKQSYVRWLSDIFLYNGHLVSRTRSRPRSSSSHKFPNRGTFTVCRRTSASLGQLLQAINIACVLVLIASSVPRCLFTKELEAGGSWPTSSWFLTPTRSSYQSLQWMLSGHLSRAL